MKDEIPKAIKAEFTITSDSIKYPTYLDDEFQKSISEEENLNNYTKENIKKSFDDFFQIFQSCKDKVYDIISNNLHNFQDYCRNINIKSINYVFYFNIFEKFAKLLVDKYYNNPIKQKTEIFTDEIIYDVIHKNKNFSVLYKKDYKDEKNGVNKINQILNPVLEKYNKIMRSKNKIGNIIVRTFKYLNKYLFVPFEQELIKFQKIEVFFENNYFKTNNNEENAITILNVIIYLNKIRVLEYAFHNCALVKPDDICNLEETSKEWLELKKILFRLIPEKPEELKNQYIERNKSPDIFLSVLSNIPINNTELPSAASLILSGTKNYLYYKTYETKAKLDSKMFQVKSSYEDFPKYIKLFKTFKPIFNKFLPSVEFRRKIYVKKELPTINRTYIEKLINFMKGEDNPVDSSISKKMKKENNEIELPLIYKDKVPDKKLKSNYVSVTILNNKKLFFKDEKEEGLFSSIFNKFKSSSINAQIKNEFKKNTILISIHGGGFIASSTFLHERYLRKWLKEIDIPIFGINYCLAPEHKYPESLDDIFQAYMWILNHAKEELNMDVQHIILYGDSAGGNLMFSLNSLLIVLKEYDKNLSHQIILPELLLPCYPVTHVSFDNYSNSILLSLGSQMLSPGIMKYMAEQYLGNYSVQDEDLFLNPVKLNDFIMDRMTCKIRFFFGTNDIIRDDSIKLLYAFSKYNSKNGKNKIDARGYDILYLGHGFNGQSEEIQNISRNAIIPEINEFLKNII